MIDWQSLFLNSLWILGLAILLAAFSYYYWLATESGQSLRALLQSRFFQQFAWLGLGLVAAGLAGTSQQWWERLIWVLFIFYSIFNIVSQWRGRDSSLDHESSTE
jgi:hypothetical protein